MVSFEARSMLSDSFNISDTKNITFCNLQASWDLLKFREIVENAALSHFVHQEINFVEEENHRYLLEDPVVDDGVKDVP